MKLVDKRDRDVLVESVNYDTMKFWALASATEHDDMTAEDMKKWKEKLA